MLATAFCISMVLLSFGLIGIILKYLDSKPPGQESPVDKPTVLFLQALKSIAVAGQTFSIIKVLFAKIEDLPAMVLMWPLYSVQDLLFFAAFYVSATYHLLVIRPDLMEMNAGLATNIYVGVVTSYIAVTDGLFHYFGIYPPLFFILTGKPGPDSSKLFMMRRIGFCVCTVFILTLKLWGWWLNRKSRECGKPNSVLSDKAMAVRAGHPGHSDHLPDHGWHGTIDLHLYWNPGAGHPSANSHHRFQRKHLQPMLKEIFSPLATKSNPSSVWTTIFESLASLSGSCIEWRIICQIETSKYFPLSLFFHFCLLFPEKMKKLNIPPNKMHRRHRKSSQKGEECLNLFLFFYIGDNGPSCWHPCLRCSSTGFFHIFS